MKYHRFILDNPTFDPVDGDNFSVTTPSKHQDKQSDHKRNCIPIMPVFSCVCGTSARSDWDNLRLRYLELFLPIQAPITQRRKCVEFV